MRDPADPQTWNRLATAEQTERARERRRVLRCLDCNKPLRPGMYFRCPACEQRRDQEAS